MITETWLASIVMGHYVKIHIILQKIHFAENAPHKYHIKFKENSERRHDIGAFLGVPSYPIHMSLAKISVSFFSALNV